MIPGCVMDEIRAVLICVVNDIEFLAKILLLDSVLLYEVCNDTVRERKAQRRRKNGTTYAVSSGSAKGKARENKREREREMDGMANDQEKERNREKWGKLESTLGYWTSSNHKISTLSTRDTTVEFDCDTHTYIHIHAGTGGWVDTGVCRYVRARQGYKMFCKLDMLSAVYIRLPPTRARPLVEFKVRRIFLIANLHLHFTEDFRRRAHTQYNACSRLALSVNFSYLIRHVAIHFSVSLCNL